jgi:hypothetical protein
MQPLPAISAQEITREEMEQELNRLLRSGIVREHSNLRTLLEWLGRRAISDGAEPLKEYTIGVEALGKPSDYDPRLDPTVRVDIGRLRAKLSEFYRTDGASHPVHLEIPKGRYDAHYFRVPTAAPIQFPAAIPAAEPPKRRSPRLIAAGAALSVLLIAFAAIQFYKRFATAAPELSPELHSFWSPFLRSPSPTLLVYGTPMFVRLDRHIYREPRLNRWEDVEGDKEVNRMVEEFGVTEKRPLFKFTGVGEAESLFRLTRMLTEQRAQLQVKRSNNLTWEDLKGRNVILLGSQKYNPHILKLPLQPKFEADRGRVANLNPQPGETAEYPNIFREKYGDPVETYALISVYPGIEAQTRLTILACSSNEGTGGAAEYVTRPDTMKEMFQKMQLKPDAPLPAAFQYVIKVKLNEGIPVQLSYVTHHILSK